MGSGRSRRNLRRKVVHSISDSETEDQDVVTGAVISNTCGETENCGEKVS